MYAPNAAIPSARSPEPTTSEPVSSATTTLFNPATLPARSTISRNTATSRSGAEPRASFFGAMFPSRRARKARFSLVRRAFSSRSAASPSPSGRTDRGGAAMLGDDVLGMLPEADGGIDERSSFS